MNYNIQGWHVNKEVQKLAKVKNRHNRCLGLLRVTVSVLSPIAPSKFTHSILLKN